MAHNHTWKFHLLMVWVFLMTVGLFAYFFTRTNVDTNQETRYGITYSWVYAEQLNSDPIQTYRELLEGLEVKSVRLPLYWSEIEHNEDQRNWEIPDQLIDLSEQYGVDLTLVIGSKVPRWPECFIPDWAERLNPTYQQTEVLDFIEAGMVRYDNHEHVIRWQIDNEPFFPFGECPQLEDGMFEERVAKARELTNKPIQITASGEVGPWTSVAGLADVLGISMYRQTHNDLVGQFVYPLTPSFYYFRSELVSDEVEKVIVSELQAEPWFSQPRESRELTEWYENFTAEMFQSNIEFAQQAQLSEVYLWGAEWWYALREAGDDRLWGVAEDLFIYEQ